MKFTFSTIGKWVSNFLYRFSFRGFYFHYRIFILTIQSTQWIYPTIPLMSSVQIKTVPNSQIKSTSLSPWINFDFKKIGLLTTPDYLFYYFLGFFFFLSRNNNVCTYFGNFESASEIQHPGINWYDNSSLYLWILF